jgi:hypothetical protein
MLLRSHFDFLAPVAVALSSRLAIRGDSPCLQISLQWLVMPECRHRPALHGIDHADQPIAKHKLRFRLFGNIIPRRRMEAASQK